MIKAIIYDLDGVLVDATEWHYESLNEALMEICDFKISRSEHLTTFNGLPTNTKLDILYKQGKITSNEDFKLIWDLKQQKTIDVISKNAIQDSVKLRLHMGTKSYKKACVTNSIKKTARLMLEKTGQLNFMDFLISNEDVDEPKPSPEGYITAISKLNLKPNECMIVEDSPKGITAAKLSQAFVYEVSGYHEVTLENIIQKISQFNLEQTHS